MLRQLAYRLMKSETCLRLMAAGLCLRNGCGLHRDGETYILKRGARQIRISRQHLLYSIDTARHFDTYFSQVIPEQNGIQLEVNYSEARLHTLANGLQFELSSMPEETSALDAYFRFHHPKRGDLVFDIGAYCGVFTSELSRAVGPQGKVIAFEPDPLNVELLRRNITRHNLSNVTVAQVAVSDTNGTAAFNSDGSLGSALTLALSRPPTHDTTEVRTITLEKACTEFGVPSFVKIDAEGAEIEILSSAKTFLQSHPIHFVLDTSHMRNGHLTCKAVEDLLKSSGYKVTSGLDSGGFMTTWAQVRG
jgi:FkbM family methyltransferase